MVEPGGVDRSGMINPERQAQIDQMEKIHRDAFDAWAKDPANHQSLSITDEAAQYLIPRRVLELSDPSRVHVSLLEAENSWVSFLVLAEQDDLLTNPDDYHTLQQARNSESKLSDSQRAQLKIDPMHAVLTDLIDSGTIGFRDKVYVWMTLEKHGDDEIFVGQMYDNPQTQGQGIATSLYNKVRSLKEVGFNYLTGQNTSRDHLDPTKPGNVNFFLEKMGRTKFADLPDDMQKMFYNNHAGSPDSIEDPESFTIDFLDPSKKPPTLPASH